MTETRATWPATEPDVPPLNLRTLVGQYAHTASFRSGAVRSDRVQLCQIDIMPVYPAFRSMVRTLAFDVCEMAIVTYLMAKDRGVPLVLVPAVLVGRFPHTSLLCNSERRPVTVSHLKGRTIGVRSYTQTSGVWMRGILENEHGLDLRKLHWLTFEDAHVACYNDPPLARRASADDGLFAMLVSGKIDAAIAELPADPRIQPVFANRLDVGRAWARSHGLTPINHMVVVRGDLVQSHPWLPSELFRLLVASKAAAGHRAGSHAPLPYGVSANLVALDMIAFYAFQQGLVSHRYHAESLFDETTRHLDP